MERLIIFSLLLGVAHSWSITSQFPRRSLAENRATTRVYMGSKVKKGAQTKKRSGGFGKVEEKKKEVIGTGAKAQREQYESFANLAKGGATQYAVLVRKNMKEEEPGAWTAVGTVASSSGSAEDGIQLQRKLIFEHAAAILPPLGLIAPTFLECGFYEGEGDDYDGEQTVTIAKKATPADGTTVGFREIPIRQKAVRDRDRGYS